MCNSQWHQKETDMKKLKEKLASFMYGRNGVDEIYKAVMLSELVIMMAYLIVRMFTKNKAVSAVFTLIIFAGLVYMMFRCMSKNILKRRAENKAYLDYLSRQRAKRRLAANKRRDRKTHVYKDCPGCKAVIRLPRVKGMHTVKCPRCSERFDVKI